MKKIYTFLSKSKTATLMAKQEERPDRKSPGKQEPERRNWLLRLPVAGGHSKRARPQESRSQTGPRGNLEGG